MFSLELLIRHSQLFVFEHILVPPNTLKVKGLGVEAFAIWRVFQWFAKVYTSYIVVDRPLAKVYIHKSF